MHNSLKLSLFLFLSFYSLCGFGQDFTVTVNQAIQDAPVDGYVTVQLTMAGFENISQGNFALKFDDTAFSYVGSSNFNIPTLNPSTMTFYDQGFIDITFGEEAGVTVDDGTIAFNLTFLRITEGEAALQFFFDNDIFHFIANTSNSPGIMELGQVVYTSFLGNTIIGSLYNNFNNDCIYSNSSLSFDETLITLESEDNQFQTYASSNGSYLFYAPPGTYELSSNSPYEIWEECPPIEVVVVDNEVQYDAHLGLTASQSCELMSIEISTPVIIRCFDTEYQVEYCNIGTLPVGDAVIEIVLDEDLTYESSSIPFSSQADNTLIFEIDNTIDVGSCYNFTINAIVGCDDVVLGQTHCTTASISPFENCDEPAPTWDGSDIKLMTECTGNEVIFTLRNDGEDMTTNAEFKIIEDLFVSTSEDVLLTSGNSVSFSFPANGSTYRGEVNQSVGHPFSNMEVSVIEACGLNDAGEISIGFVNAFSTALDAPNMSRWCMENVGSYDPNDKQAFPVGATEQHFIEANTDIEYLIRFQNTGTFTAFNVVVLDTLSELFDISTIKLGNSSHDYRLDILEGNVLEFNFENIMLPDSATNELESNGYFTYKISQQPDLEDDNVLENSAAIYFDFNEPVITNTTFHTIGREFLETSSLSDVASSDVSFSVKPNPASASTTIYLDDYFANEGMLNLYNLRGELIYSIDFVGNSVDLERTNLNAGIYLFEIRNEGEMIGTDKIVFE